MHVILHAEVMGLLCPAYMSDLFRSGHVRLHNFFVVVFADELHEALSTGVRGAIA